MPILTDRPPEGADSLIDAAIGARRHHGPKLRLEGPISVARPVAHRYFTVSRSAMASFRLRPVRSWDYPLFGAGAVAFATLRQSRSRLTFEGLTGGAVAQRLFEAFRIASRELGDRPERLYLRIFECRAARLMSVVLQSRSGPSFYLNVLDNTLLPESALRLEPNVHGLRTLARERLASVRG